ncbi:MAG: peptide deformylase [Clostridia bacterium]|nr:peptide deformylase [Clostridia bacterium]MBR3805479.1 peptide deformylase [Clostridia bacterium]
MAKLKIVKFGDPMLRKVSRPVTEITPRICTLIDDMIETMRDAGGCGLAAVQVGVLRRIAVIEVEEGTVYELINPKIISFAGEQEDNEGCLSNPGNYGITKRPKAVTVRATDRHGKEYELTGSDLLARAICHECDHLDGKLYTDVQIRPLRPDELK